MSLVNLFEMLLVVVTDDQALKDRNLTIILDLLGKLNVGVLSVETFVKIVDFVFV